MVNTDRDDQTIGDDTELLRRIPPRHFYTENNGSVRPSSAAFENDPNGGPMSIAIMDELDRLNLQPECMLIGHDSYGLVAFTAGLARELGQKIIRDPIDGEPAHGLVVGAKTGSVKKKLYKGCRWIIPPPKE